MDFKDLKSKIKEFEKIDKDRNKFNKNIWKKHSEFLKVFPFRKNPESIDKLTPQQIYNPYVEDKKYFFYWIDYGLRRLGHITIGGAGVWRNARNNLDTMKKLLKITVDDSLSIANKIDAHWEDIRGFGGDHLIAKKILFCYYPKKIICAYKTKDLEDFANTLNLKYREESRKKYGKEYKLLSVGQKFEFFNGLLLSFKNKHKRMKEWSNWEFISFLYECYPPSRITKTWNGGD